MTGNAPRACTMPGDLPSPEAAVEARIVTATDEIRCRIERDLHDALQQRLMSLGLRGPPRPGPRSRLATPTCSAS
jgi:signal transduction histidine kinase